LKKKKTFSEFQGKIHKRTFAFMI